MRSSNGEKSYQLMDENGIVLEINSQGSLGTSPEVSPEKLKQKEARDDDEDNLGCLCFDDKELANSFAGAANAKDANSSPQKPPLSTRSETEEEKGQRLQIRLRQLKLMT